MEKYVVIVAGGSGKRMGADIPKQFLEIAGRPVLMHTIERFKTYCEDIDIITVLPENQLLYWVELKEKHSFSVPHTLVKGGSNRFYSVKNGLKFVSENGLVAIHDGVRPFVSIETIKRCFDTAARLGNAIPVISPTESLRQLNDSGSHAINRLMIKQVQTPQVFNAKVLKSAYKQDYVADFTDDATVVERSGEKINLVEGNRENIKITNPEDLLFSAALLTTDF